MSCSRPWRSPLPVGDGVGGSDGNNAVLIDLEGHGREEMFEGVDLSQTVGWFTSTFPVRLDPGMIDLDEAFAGGPALGRALKAIKEQLRAVPHNGIGYGLLRYLNPETAQQLASMAAPQVGFNYLGRFEASASEDWGSAPELMGLTASADPTMPLAHALELDAIMLDSLAGPELHAVWSWASALLKEDDVRALAGGWFTALRALAKHAAEPGAGGHTPSDFALVALSQTEIERLEREYLALEDVLPLSPLQEGLLFHAAYDGGVADVYILQLVMALEGSLDPTALKAAVRGILQRHSILRSCFPQEGLSQPVQVVVSDARLPWQSIDLTSLDEASRTERFRQIVDEDRTRRFDLARPPLVRSALISLTPDSHRLVLTAHHILLDGWSIPLLVQELLVMYAQSPNAAALPSVTPYRDYLAWLARQDRASAAVAWREALADIEEGTFLAPVNRRRERAAPEEFHLALSESLTAELKRLARDHGLTLNTLVQGSWAILLGRLTGRDDVVFGITVAGRPPDVIGVERMVGLFINTAPLRVRLPAAQSMITLFKNVQKSHSDLMPHQHLGLAEIQRLCNQGELFDTLVVFENYPLVQGSIDHPGSGLRLSGIDGRDATHYALALTANPGDRLALRFGYQPDLFNSDEVEILAGRFVRLLQAAADMADRPIGLLEILDPAEQRAILSWNETAHAVPPGAVLELFAAQVENRRDATAVACDDDSLSYAELDVRANQLAHHLRALGIGPEGVVGLCAGRSLDMVVGLLGILKAGAAYLPLDPSYPKERLAFMLKNARVSVLVSEARLIAVWPEDVATIVQVDADWPVIARQPQAAPYHGLHPDNPAYVMYTSGSTGAPKGVVVTHRGLLNYAAWAIDEYPLQEGSGAPVNTPISFDATVTSLLLPLLSGGRVVLLPEDRQFELLTDRAGESDDFSLIKLTPAHVELMTQLVPTERLEGLTRCLVIGGEALRGETVAPWRRHCPQTRLINEYGPTETVVGCGVYEVQAGDPIHEAVPIGRPIWNTRFYVLDRGMRLVPAGVIGELYIAGAGLARGYFNQPALTAERFVADPFGYAGSRMYRTGDLARRRHDGVLEFVGRSDAQVKIRGFRIEPGEIEETLLRHPSVAQVAVIAREDWPGDKRLAAYVVADADGTIDVAALRENLAQSLPAFMVPSTIVCLARLPITSNGKLDRNALPAPDLAFAPGRYPRTHVEECLCSFYAEVLGRESVGIDDDFFALGGHSLKAMQIVSRIRSGMGLQISLRDFFQHPTVAAQAQLLETAHSVETDAIQPAPLHNYYPLSPAQKRLYLASCFDKASVAYNMPKAFMFDQPIDQLALTQALQSLVNRHEALRTAFVEIDGEPLQRILTDAHFAVALHDFAALDPATAETRARSLAHAFAHQEFDLTAPPLMRAALVSLPSGRACSSSSFTILSAMAGR